MRYELKFGGKALAAGAILLLAVVLALAGTMAKGTAAGPLDAAAIAKTINAERDHVTPGELARWLIEKRQDFQLIDIRQPWQFDDYHIPGAVNIPLSQLFEDSGLKQLSREKKIVLYGYGAGHAAQAQLLLATKGYKAYSLREGIVQWWEAVMTPFSIRADQPSPAGYLQDKALREHFMGGAAAPSSVPSVAPPPSQPAPQATPPPANKLKLGRGCS